MGAAAILLLNQVQRESTYAASGGYPGGGGGGDPFFTILFAITIAFGIGMGGLLIAGFLHLLGVL